MRYGSKVERRIIIGPCRSGTSVLFHALSQNPLIEGHFQHIKDTLRKTGKSGHDFFSMEPAEEGAILMDKETIGHSTEKDCAFEIFPDTPSIEAARPIFIFRDPVETYNSWAKYNLGNPDLFIQAYKHTAEQFKKARESSNKTFVTTYDLLTNSPERVLKAICGQWDIEFNEKMLKWDKKFGDNETIDEEGIEEGHYSDLSDSEEIAPKKNPVTIAREIAERIRAELRSVYADIQQLSVAQLEEFEKSEDKKS